MLRCSACRSAAVDDRSHPPAAPDLIGGDANLDLASNRTALSFDSTRMSADNTLMATVRTSLSLISFGFTIYKVLGNASSVLPRASESARNIGMAMLILGLVVLATGIVSRARFGRELNRRCQRLFQAELLAADTKYSAAATYLAALALLVIGLSALASIFVRLSRLDG
jgi:putative membrane protein